MYRLSDNRSARGARDSALASNRNTCCRVLRGGFAEGKEMTDDGRAGHRWRGERRGGAGATRMQHRLVDPGSGVPARSCGGRGRGPGDRSEEAGAALEGKRRARGRFPSHRFQIAPTFFPYAAVPPSLSAPRRPFACSAQLTGGQPHAAPASPQFHTTPTPRPLPPHHTTPPPAGDQPGESRHTALPSTPSPFPRRPLVAARVKVGGRPFLNPWTGSRASWPAALLCGAGGGGGAEKTPMCGGIHCIRASQPVSLPQALNFDSPQVPGCYSS
ncbi:hypothetical protein BS78_05G128000 [Paspalum vaginatum]|nr:hypothetical protein BS78_05G128000 [Paspalum vaginatum]